MPYEPCFISTLQTQMWNAPANSSVKRCSVWHANRKKRFQPLAPNTEPQHSFATATSERRVNPELIVILTLARLQISAAKSEPFDFLVSLSANTDKAYVETEGDADISSSF
jgi:hypothetical protein